MKATRFLTLIAIAVVLGFFATGCRPQNMTTIPSRPPELGQHDVSPAPGITPGSENPNGNPLIPMSDFPGHTNWVEHADILADDTVHFAYDSSAIKSADKSRIANVADYLKKNPDAAVRVEGNADERGTAEYNRSLGERRALAAREQLVHLGIAADRVDTVSYGFDKPVDPARNEEAYKKNRRDDFVVLTPPAK